MKTLQYAVVLYFEDTRTFYTIGEYNSFSNAWNAFHSMKAYEHTGKLKIIQNMYDEEDEIEKEKEKK